MPDQADARLGLRRGRFSSSGFRCRVRLSSRPRQPVDPCQRVRQFARRPCLDGRRRRRSRASPARRACSSSGVPRIYPPAAGVPPPPRAEAGVGSGSSADDADPARRRGAGSEHQTDDPERRSSSNQTASAASVSQALTDTRHLGATIGRELGQDAAVQEQWRCREVTHSRPRPGRNLRPNGEDAAGGRRPGPATPRPPTAHRSPSVVVTPHRRRSVAPTRRPASASFSPRLRRFEPDHSPRLGRSPGRAQGGDGAARRTGRRQHDQDRVGDPAHELTERRPGRRMVDDVQPVEHQAQRAAQARALSSSGRSR